MAYPLAPLPYAFDALEPVLDARTMEIHHDKHHQAYVTNLNNALKEHPELERQPLEALITDLSQVPEAIRTAVRNNGGGSWNHAFFWETMTPNAPAGPTGALAKALDTTFGSLETFKEKLQAAGASHFGSGWVWLCVHPDKTLGICTTPGHDNPTMKGISPCGGRPILVIDLWEHAYYLTYQNRRPDYLKAWWGVCNWAVVEERYEAVI